MFGSISLGILLTMAAYFGDPVLDAQKNYSNCLVRFTVEHLKLKTTAKDFEEAAKTACASQSKAFRDISISEQVREGDSRSEAETYADEEVQYVIEVFTESYPEHLANGTVPVEQK